MAQIMVSYRVPETGEQGDRSALKLEVRLCWLRILHVLRALHDCTTR